MASAGGIESQNVVGYQDIEIPAGSSMSTATFKAMSGVYKISDIKVNGAVGGGMDYAQKINADGMWNASKYYYLTMEEMDVADGWYKDEFGDEPVTDGDVLNVGEGLMFTAANDFSVTYAGEVIKGNPSVSVPQGLSMVGNPVPVSVKISEIKVTGAVGGGMDYVQKINADGSWGNPYYYLTMEEMDVADGWYKDAFGDESVADDDVLNVGEAVMFSSALPIVLDFPSVLE